MAEERDAGAKDPDEAAADGGFAQPDEAVAGGAIDEKRLRAALEELRRLRVEDLAGEMMVTLVTVGYQKMGVTDQTRELRDLGDVRLAIELLRACVETLARERGEAAGAAARETLDAMQLDYARIVMAGDAPRTQTAHGEGADAAQPEDAGPEEPTDESEGAGPEGPVGESEGAGPGDASPGDET